MLPCGRKLKKSPEKLSRSPTSISRSKSSSRRKFPPIQHSPPACRPAAVPKKLSSLGMLTKNPISGATKFSAEQLLWDRSVRLPVSRRTPLPITIQKTTEPTITRSRLTTRKVERAQPQTSQLPRPLRAHSAPLFWTQRRSQEVSESVGPPIHEKLRMVPK